ncbi:hypothetical protein D3C72_1540000 [compost metagenome]
MDTVLLMSARDRPWARAFSSSISNWYWGSSRRPLARTRLSTGFFAASSTNWSRAAFSASWPMPPRSCRKKLKPVALPSSITAGGAKAKTIASRKLKKCFCARWARSNTLWPSAVRSSHGLSMRNARPELWPRPAKLKPVTVNTEFTVSFSSSSRYSRIWSTTAWVRSALAPDGVCTWANSTPWSSSGRKAVGMRVNSQPMATRITT